MCAITMWAMTMWAITLWAIIMCNRYPKEGTNVGHNYVGHKYVGPNYIQPLPKVIKNVSQICSNLCKSMLGCFGRPLVHEMPPGAQKSTQHHFLFVSKRRWVDFGCNI